jgi:hypothetical protein
MGGWYNEGRVTQKHELRKQGIIKKNVSDKLQFSRLENLKNIFCLETKSTSYNCQTNGPSNKFIFRATYGNSIVCNIFPA